MWHWFSQHLADILLSLALLAIVVLILRRWYHNKRAGINACGCDCSHCGGGCAQHRPSPAEHHKAGD